MNELLKGNFKTRIAVQDEAPKPSLEDQFEKAALKRLGGSMCFVARKKVIWELAEKSDGKTGK